MEPYDDLPPPPEVVSPPDPALRTRIGVLLEDLDAADPDQRATPEADLVTIGAPAVERLLFAMTDARESVEVRARAGTLVGRVGDPRLPGPDFVGPFLRVTSGAF